MPNFIVEDEPTVYIKRGTIAKIEGLPSSITTMLLDYEIGTMEGAVTIVYSETVMDSVEGSTVTGTIENCRDMTDNEATIYEAFEKCVKMMGDHCDVIIM
tara:strand:+ start:179 stop:478 length:300 start_codon:yes stop_codon:yes gene_type:complete